MKRTATLAFCIILSLTAHPRPLAQLDARAPSVGMTLDELARLLLEFDAVAASNLDGGGSTTMVVRGKVVNRPSCPKGERPVSDALLLTPRGRAR